MITNIVYIVEESVSKEFAITMEDLKSKKRKRDVILAQDFLYYILHCEYKISVNKIGEMYQRSSRNIFYSLSKTSLLLKDSIYQTIYAKLIYGLREKKETITWSLKKSL